MWPFDIRAKRRKRELEKWQKESLFWENLDSVVLRSNCRYHQMYLKRWTNDGMIEGEYCNETLYVDYKDIMYNECLRLRRLDERYGAAMDDNMKFNQAFQEALEKIEQSEEVT